MPMSGSSAVRDGRRVLPYADKHVTSKRVTTTFEAWDPSLAVMVTMKEGAPLRVIQIVFDKRFGAGRAAIKRAVEFESSGIRYYAAFDTFQENTTPEAQSDESRPDAR